MINKVTCTIWGNEIFGFFDDVRDIMMLRCLNSTMKSVMDDAIGIYHGVLVAKIEEIEENMNKLKSEYDVLFDEFNRVIKAESFLDSIPYIHLRMRRSPVEQGILEVICLVLQDDPYRYVSKNFIFSRNTISSMLKATPDEVLLETIQTETAISMLKSQHISRSKYSSSILDILNWLYKYLDLVEEIHLAPDIYQSIITNRTKLRNFNIIRRQLDAYYIRCLNNLLRL
jgi:hypothetical protein